MISSGNAPVVQEDLDRLIRAVRSDRCLSEQLLRVEVSKQQWSAGGGVHFSAMHKDGVPVLLKVGVDQGEVRWIQEVYARAPHLCPRLYSTGTAIGELAMAWIITEALPYGPLGPLWGGAEFDLLIDAAVEFQRIAGDVEDPAIPRMSVERLLADLDRGMSYEPPGPVRAVASRAEDDFEWVYANCEDGICHGDLHLCNGLTRVPPPGGPVVLIDFSPIRQPWAMEAAYLQVLNSTDPGRSGFRGLVQKMARSRERLGMSSCDDVEKLSRIALGWMAISRWGREFDRHSISGYVRMTEEYIHAAQHAHVG